jgi:ribonuclease PH
MYGRLNVVSSIARQQRKSSNMATMDTIALRRKELAWNIIDYHMVPMATISRNAAVTSLDSKWTPRRHFWALPV